MAPPIHLTIHGRARMHRLDACDSRNFSSMSLRRPSVRPSLALALSMRRGRRCLRVRPSLIMMRDRERRRLDDAAILRVRRPGCGGAPKWSMSSALNAGAVARLNKRSDLENTPLPLHLRLEQSTLNGAVEDLFAHNNQGCYTPEGTCCLIFGMVSFNPSFRW